MFAKVSLAMALKYCTMNRSRSSLRRNGDRDGRYYLAIKNGTESSEVGLGEYQSHYSCIYSFEPVSGVMPDPDNLGPSPDKGLAEGNFDMKLSNRFSRVL